VSLTSLPHTSARLRMIRCRIIAYRDDYNTPYAPQAMNATDATTVNTNTVHAMEAVSDYNRLLRSTEVADDYGELLPPTGFQAAAPSWPLGPSFVQLENGLGTHGYPRDVSIQTCSSLWCAPLTTASQTATDMSGHWSSEEAAIYGNFIDEHSRYASRICVIW
jgi:hypothetical protein